jgi:hypothetical protein
MLLLICELSNRKLQSVVINEANSGHHRASLTGKTDTDAASLVILSPLE